MSVKAQFVTHVVENQPLALPAYNAWTTDPALQNAVERNGGGWGAAALAAHGATTGGVMMELGDQANRNKPVLRSFDRYGRRIDEVEFHPAYHQLMRHAMQAEVHNFSWRHQDDAGAHVVRAGLIYLNGQPDSGTNCPLTMTHAVVPALRNAPALARTWLPHLLKADYDPQVAPVAAKAGCTFGMGMTEKQGGSDVRRNTTRALPQPDGTYELVGHKFFFSAPMCDAHLVLAQAEGGLSCFLMPRVLPDGTLNAVRIQRLKDKLGDWSNASSEVEFQGATAWLIGEEGRGVPVIIEMVALTRLDCMLGSAAIMRQALVQAIHHTRQRSAFGRLLSDQPLMQNVLADLALESEASVALAMRVARAVDAAQRDPGEAAFARIATAIGKYWVCKRAPGFVNEAQECLGGIGYVEENILPRLYRQAPLNSIWEGSGNVQCLDVLRALRREPETREALFAELQGVKGENRALDGQIAWLKAAFDDHNSLEGRSRAVVERTATVLQAAQLIMAAPDRIGDLFAEARLGPEASFAYGTLDPHADLGSIVERAMPL